MLEDRARLRRVVAGCATSTGFAGHASATGQPLTNIPLGQSARPTRLRYLRQGAAPPWNSQHTCKLVVELASDDELTAAARQDEKTAASRD